MKEGSRLFVVTSQYPAAHSEGFFTDELAALAGRFDEVVISPIVVPREPRPLPPKVRLDLSYAVRRANPWKCGLAMARAMARPQVWREGWQLLVQSPKSPADLRGALAEWLRSSYRAQAMHDRLSAVDPDADVIYFYWCLPEILGALWWRRPGGRRPAVVARGHGGDIYPEQHPRPGLFAYRAFVVQGLDALFCVSEKGARFMRGRHPQAAARIQVRRLGVSASEGLNSPPGGALVVLSIAYLSANKRIPLIADALEILHLRHPSLSIRWHHIGGGAAEAALAQRCGRLASAVQCTLHGNLDGPAVRRLLTEQPVSVIVNASLSEGLPVSLMEAAAAGIPAIAPDVGGVAEIVTGDTGVLLPSGYDATALADALETFVPGAENDARRAAARALWADRFDSEKNFGHFAAELRALAG